MEKILKNLCQKAQLRATRTRTSRLFRPERNAHRCSTSCNSDHNTRILICKNQPRYTASHFFQCRHYSSKQTGQFSIKDAKLQLYLNSVLDKFIKAQMKLVGGKIKCDKERHEINMSIIRLKPLVMPLQEYSGKEQEIEDLKQMMQEMGLEDITEAATSEITQIEEELKALEQKILFRLVPPEPVDNKNIILEVSAGVGGNEAFLFTEEIFNMYASYASYKGFHFAVFEEDHADASHGGVRKASASITGTDVYKCFKYEGGVHRVQRVPKTEKSGRIHTSTVTVAIMPQPTEIDIKINPKDLKIDTFRSSGAGGQHVNTTDSAVRIKHLPTGVVAECQTDRSQIKNKETAMKVLMSRLYQKEVEAQTAEQTQTRKMQIGTAGRSEKIRTYNFRQDRITDHRISENMHNMEDFLTDGELLDELQEKLQLEAWKEQLQEIITDFQESAQKIR